MITARIFANGRSQAVRLPKECRFEDDEVVVAKLDDIVMLFPRRKGWRVLAKGLEHFTDDFMAQRKQPAKPDRRPRI